MPWPRRPPSSTRNGTTRSFLVPSAGSYSASDACARACVGSTQMTGMSSTVAVEADVRSVIPDPGRCGSSTGSWRPRPRLASRAGATGCPGRGSGRVPWGRRRRGSCHPGPPGGARQAALDADARVCRDVLHVVCVAAALSDDPEGAPLQAVADGRDAGLPAAPPGRFEERVAPRRSPQRERELVQRVDDGLLQSVDDAASHLGPSLLGDAVLSPARPVRTRRPLARRAPTRTPVEQFGHDPMSVGGRRELWRLRRTSSRSSPRASPICNLPSER